MTIDDSAYRADKEMHRLRPKHVLDHEEFSLSWYLAQNRKFCEAMEANPSERPSEMKFKRAPGGTSA